jgi:hypothetical protein
MIGREEDGNVIFLQHFVLPNYLGRPQGPRYIGLGKKVGYVRK